MLRRLLAAAGLAAVVMSAGPAAALNPQPLPPKYLTHVKYVKYVNDYKYKSIRYLPKRRFLPPNPCKRVCR
jgi:uncharacterized protein (DUF4213/DUF364 family)